MAFQVEILCPLCGSHRKTYYRYQYKRSVVRRYRCAMCGTFYTRDGSFWRQLALPMPEKETDEFPLVNIPLIGEIS